MPHKEIPLSGGNVNSGVVRVGNSVRRTQTPASPAIHRLLRHLENRGFTACPKFLGIDSENREILSYIDGETGVQPDLWEGDEPLAATARLLRIYHDATETYLPLGTESWAFNHRDAACHDVICHNDFAPYNFIFTDGVPHSVLDFDLSAPGPRLWDVAYAAYWMTPLSFHASDMRPFAESDLGNGCRRLRLFCEIYRIPADNKLLDMVARVLSHMADAGAMAAVVGEAVAEKLMRNGHLEHWRCEKEAFGRHKSALKLALKKEIS